MARSRAASSAAPTQSLARGCEILRLFASGHESLSQTEAAELIGVSVPTAHRLLRTLEAYRLVARHPETLRYQVGLGVLELVPPLLQSFDAPTVAAPFVRQLVAAVDETANFATLVGREVLYLASDSPSRLITVDTPAGLRLPAHCTAIGKALLAQLSDDQVRRSLGEEPYQDRTAKTHTTWAELVADLQTIRERGYAESIEEYEQGLCSWAVAVPTQPPRRYALNVAVPSSRWSRGMLDEKLIPTLLDVSQALAKQIPSLSGHQFD